MHFLENTTLSRPPNCRATSRTHLPSPSSPCTLSPKSTAGAMLTRRLELKLDSSHRLVVIDANEFGVRRSRLQIPLHSLIFTASSLTRLSPLVLRLLSVLASECS